MSKHDQSQRSSIPEAESQRRRLSAVVGLIVLVLVVLVYYIIHKPAAPRVLVNLLGLVIDLASSSLILGICTCMGAVVLERWATSVQVRPVVHTAIGLGLASVGLMVLGLFGLLTPAVVLSGTALLVLILRHRLSATLKDAWSSLGRIKPVRPADWVVGCAVLVLVAMALAEALSPPVHYDALVYHLTLPEGFVQTGSLSTGVENPFWGQPLLVEMLFSWARLITGRTTAMVVLGWMAGVLALATIYHSSRSLIGDHGWIAIASLMAGSTISSSLGWGYVDWWAALVGATAIEPLLGLYQSPRQGLARLVGLVCGIAVGIKLTSGVLLLAGVLVVLVRHRRQGLRAVAGTLVAAAIAISPWLIKNTVIADAPFYPFVGRSGLISPALQRFFAESGDASTWDVLLAPIRASLLGSEGAPGFAATIGPLLLGLSVVGLMRWGLIRRKIRWLAATVLAWWVIWATAAALRPLLIQSRIYMVMFPMWAIVAAAGYSTLARARFGQVRFRVLADTAILTVLILSTVQGMVASARRGSGAYLLGELTKDEYLTRRLGAAYPAMQAAGDEGSAPGSVLLLWEARSFYCRPNCVPDAWIGRWYSEMRDQKRTDAILAEWSQEGIERLMVYNDGVRFIQAEDPRYSEVDWAVLAEVQANLDPVRSIGSSYTIYAVP